MTLTQHYLRFFLDHSCHGKLTHHKFVCMCVLHIYIGNGMEKKEGKECVHMNNLLIYIMSWLANVKST